MDRIKALIVDDKRIIGDMFSFILGYSGHDVTVVRSAQDAAEKIRKDDFDVVFLDIIMPERDGVSLLEEIKVLDPKLPVIIMSGYSAVEQKDRIKELGVNAYLDKPFEIDDVRRSVKLAIGKEI